MRALMAVVGLVTAAIAILIVVAFLRPSTASPPPGSQEEAMQTKTDSKQSPPSTAGAAKMTTFDAVKFRAVRAQLDIEGRGTIVLELYPKAAPQTVAHFRDLCRRHFYDGVLVHRVEPDPSFRLFQAGDPVSKGMDPKALRGKTTAQVGDEFHLGEGGSGVTVPLEAVLPNSAGSLGLARSQSPDSGDSQFYVNLSDNAALNGQYCVFGRVVQGLDVAQKVQIGDKIHSLSCE
jgi:cyclophilin family peptidyl-prolyl cis-trans isomerase